MNFDSFEQSWRMTPDLTWQTAALGSVTLLSYGLALDIAPLFAGREVPPLVLALVVHVFFKLVIRLIYLDWSGWDAFGRWGASVICLVSGHVLLAALVWADAETVMSVYALVVGGLGAGYLLYLWTFKGDTQRLPAFGAWWDDWGEVAVIWEGLANVALAMALTVMALWDAQAVYIVSLSVGVPLLYKLKNCALVMMIWAHQDTYE